LFLKIRQVIDFSIDYLYFLNKKKESEKIIILSGINVKKFIAPTIMNITIFSAKRLIIYSFSTKLI
jgi:hypothetical protein